VIWGMLATSIPVLVGRIAAWALIIGIVSYLYLTTVRRLVLRDGGVDIELSRRKAFIPYSNLDHVIVRAQLVAGTLSVRFVTRDPPEAIRCRIGLVNDEIARIAPQLVEILEAHVVDVRQLQMRVRDGPPFERRNACAFSFGDRIGSECRWWCASRYDRHDSGAVSFDAGRPSASCPVWNE